MTSPAARLTAPIRTAAMAVTSSGSELAAVLSAPSSALRLEHQRADHVQGVGVADLRAAPATAQQHLAGLGQRDDLDLVPPRSPPSTSVMLPA
jgi:hypothetical protein